MGAFSINAAHQPEGHGRCWNAAQCQQADQPPADMAVAMMHSGTRHLGHGGIEQISPYGGCRMNAEQQHHQRCHQRRAADAGNANQTPDDKARQRHQGVKRKTGQNGTSSDSDMADLAKAGCSGQGARPYQSAWSRNLLFRNAATCAKSGGHS